MFYAEYQGTYAYVYPPTYIYSFNYYQVSIVEFLRAAYFLGYQYGAINSLVINFDSNNRIYTTFNNLLDLFVSYELNCIGNITAMTMLDNSTAANRFYSDYSYVNGTWNSNLEVYRLKCII